MPKPFSVTLYVNLWDGEKKGYMMINETQCQTLFPVADGKSPAPIQGVKGNYARNLDFSSSLRDVDGQFSPRSLSNSTQM